MVKVLCVIMTKFFEGGGLSTVMLNYYRELWQWPVYADRLQIDFLSHGDIKDELRAEIEAHGCHFFSMPGRKSNPIGHYRTFDTVLRNGNYDVLHYNCNSGLDGLELAIAKKYVNNRICHIHNSSPRYPLGHRILVGTLRRSYTKAVAVSEESGRWLYGDGADFEVLNNAIDVHKFSYDATVRERKRAELGVGDNTFVVGSIGRMKKGDQKNTGFLIRVFALAHKRMPDSRLVIVGDGDLRPRWEHMASELSVADAIDFLGFRTDVAEWMQAFDVFCFPSRWEGLPLAAVEAQAAGLPVLASETIPHEIGITPLVSFLPIGEEDERAWADEILLRAKEPLPKRGDPDIAQNLSVSGYDIRHEVEKLVALYGLTQDEVTVR